MPSRVLGSLALIMVAVAAERFAHFGLRSLLAMHMSQWLHMTAAEIGSLYAWLMIASLLASLAAGGLAFVLPPRGIALIGAVLSVLGIASFALASSPTAVIASLVLTEVGSGLVRPCAFGYAARVLTYEGDTELVAPSGRRFLSMGCFVTLLYGAVNVGAAMAAPFFGAAYARVGIGMPSVLAAVSVCAAAAGFGISMVVDRENPAPSSAPAAHTAYRTEPSTGAAPPSAPTNPMMVIVALGLALPNALAYLVMQTADMAVLMGDNGGYAESRSLALLQVTSTGGGIVAAVVVGVVLLVLAQSRSSLSLALFVGIGLIMFAGGAVLMVPSAFVARLLGMMSMGLAEPLLNLGVVYAALAVRGKAATAVVAGFLFLEMLGSQLGGALVQIATPVTLLGAALLLGCGIALAALSRKVRSLFQPA